jgi:hypothetical protein
MQLSFRLDKRPGESHLALDGKKILVCCFCGWFLWFFVVAASLVILVAL